MGAAGHSEAVIGCRLSVVRLPTKADRSLLRIGSIKPDNRQPTTDNMARSFMCTVVAVWAITSVVAQTVGKLRLMIDPGAGFEFVLDHKYRLQQREVELSTGPHHFTIWAPERTMVDTTFIVLENQTRDVMVRLPFSPEFRAYEEELRQEKKKMWLNVAVPAAATLGAGILTYSTFKRYRNAYDQLAADEAAYRTGADPRTLEDLKSEVIPRHKDEFTDRRGLFFVSVGILGAVAAGSTYMIMRYTKRPVPKFFDREKVKFDGLVWLPSVDDGGMWLTGVHLNLR